MTQRPGRRIQRLGRRMCCRGKQFRRTQRFVPRATFRFGVGIGSAWALVRRGHWLGVGTGPAWAFLQLQQEGKMHGKTLRTVFVRNAVGFPVSAGD